MKKLFSILAAVLFCVLVACSDNKTATGGMSEKTKKNLDASHIINEAFKSGDISKLDSVVAADFVDHTDRGDMGRDSLKAMVKWMHSKPNDMKMDLVREFANDDYVYSHMRFRGTSDGTMGPVGPYDISEIEVVRFNSESKAVEHWAYMEMTQMMKMMGGQQPPPAGNKTDTTKKADSKL